MKITTIGAASRLFFDAVSTQKIELVTDIHQVNLVTLMSKQIEKSNSAFKSSQIQYESYSKFCNLAKYANSSDYIIIDLLDEAYDVLSYEDNKFTLTYDLQQELEEADLKREYSKYANAFDTKWKEICLAFIETLRKVVSSDQIILHEVYFTEEYLKENKAVKLENYKEVAQVNEKLQKMYDFFKKNFEGIGTIKMDENYAESIFTPVLKFNLPGSQYFKKYYTDLYNTFDNTQEYYKIPFTTHMYLLPHANIDFKFCVGGEAEIQMSVENEEKTVGFWTNFYDNLLKVNRTLLPVLKEEAEYLLEIDTRQNDLDIGVVINFFNDEGQVFYSQKCTERNGIIKTPTKFNFYRIYLKVKGKGKAHINYLKIRRHRKQGYVTAFDKVCHCPDSENIKYLLKKKASEYLVVVFHGFNPYVTKYEFLGVLKDMPVNTLYLLDDYGLNGRFYQDTDRKDNLQRNIIELIESIAQQCNVAKQNIIMLGGSKGGGSALYYGLRMNVGHVVAGGPPIYWGIFNSSYYHQSSLVKNVSGGVSEEDTKYMDSILPSLLHEDIQTKIEFLSITNDIYYEGYFEKFAKLLGENKIEYHNLLKDGKGHGDLPKHLGSWAKQTVTNIIS
ncbi:hypothetical protein H9I32_29085 [Bacillus sp. Xin]|uniref:accessory Sec system protein Asp2 n=1 Tax=unclassified Bacillus (in: firmicutes) TaxID=185979 RepID=UPI00157236BA|nr:MULTISPECIES: DUF6270 domain-containing protein [unclassified Bacillus (in: firmicutes)]MBC6976278.1 hypothetical protein [Bacillus sp. Xin]NSW36172.1 hypothetical protein [Bacillus sp. Xin1]